jgi:hypothetical protein
LAAALTAVAGSRLYWANELVSTSPFVLANTIGRANLDGSDVNESFISDPNEPVSVAVSSSTPGLVLSAPSIAADGVSSTTATMTVSDQFGNGVSGDHVAITSSDPSQQVGPVTNPSLGIYQALITSTNTPEAVIVTATDTSVSPSVSGIAALAQTSPTGSTSPTGTVPPIIRDVSQSHRTWRTSGRKVKHAPPIGTTFTFSLNRPATVTLTFAELITGHRGSHGKCLRGKPSGGHQRSCSLSAKSGLLSDSAKAGRNTVPFKGRLAAGTTLRPGRYTVTLKAGSAGPSPKLTFTIVSSRS